MVSGAAKRLGCSAVRAHRRLGGRARSGAAHRPRRRACFRDSAILLSSCPRSSSSVASSSWPAMLHRAPPRIRRNGGIRSDESGPRVRPRPRPRRTSHRLSRAAGRSLAHLRPRTGPGSREFTFVPCTAVSPACPPGDCDARSDPSAPDLSSGYQYSSCGTSPLDASILIADDLRC